MPSELANYACYGSMTREVAETLLNKRVHYGPALIPQHGIRYLTHKLMSDAERKVMQGSSRFIAVPDFRYTRGIKGGIIFGLPKEETAILEAFDNSSEDEYVIKTHEIVAIQGLQGQFETKLPAILVARKRMWKKNYGEWRHSFCYDPYEPFSKSMVRALAVASEFRETFLKDAPEV